MPRLPTYRLHKASGRAVIQWRPLFGPNPHYLPGKFGSPESLEAYEHIRATILASIHGKPAPPKPIPKHGSVTTLAAAFLDWAKGYCTKTEYDNFRHAVKLLLSTHGSLKAASFGPVELVACRAAAPRNWSRQHVNRQTQRIRRVFRWGAQSGYVDASVWLSLKAVEPLRKGKTAARETEPVKPVAWEHVARLLPFLSPMLAAMVQVQALTGMRSDELTGLRGCEIDRSRDVWVYRPAKHKTAWRQKEKIICIGPRGQALLAPFLSADPQSFLFTPRAAVRRAGRATGERYNAHSYQVAINHAFRRLGHSVAGTPRQKRGQGERTRERLKPWLKSLGIVYWHPHQLRHNAATDARAEYGVEGATAITGNTVAAAQLYAERSLDLAMRIARERG